MYKKIIKCFFVIAGLYTIFFAIVIFAFNKDVSQAYINTHSVTRFYSGESGPDRAVVIDSIKNARIARINMIENAKRTLDISYYSMEAGEFTDVFWALLVEAANRGVHVRILLDGIANGVRTKQKDIMYMIKNHPNMELKFYELPNLIKPWTFNNRLHDKYMIVDDSLVIMGGRNISDRFLALDGYEGERTYDRDIVVYHEGLIPSNSVIADLTAYFNEIYHSSYAKQSVGTLSRKEQLQGKKKEQQLYTFITKERQQVEAGFGQQIDWAKITFKTNKITLLHNPIKQFNKEPWVLYDILQLMNEAEKEIVIQSPYIVPLKKMKLKFLYNENGNSIKRKILTNSAASTPNYPAFSVYLYFRDHIVASGAQLFEYQGDYSVHTKTYMVDDDISIVGSFNLDPRSAYLSTETMMVIHSKDIHQQLEYLTNGYIEQSLLVDHDGTYKNWDNSIEERPLSWLKYMILIVVGLFGKMFAFLL